MFGTNFIKYLTDIRAHFTIKNRIAKKKCYVSITIRPIIFLRALWGHRASDIHPSFVLGLRLMSRSIIICKKDNGDPGSPKNRAKDNFVLS